MEVLINTVWQYIVGFANIPWVHYTLLTIGGIYVVLTALRAFLTGLVKVTKTDKDDKIILNLYAFLDKYAYGFGKFAEYYESHKDEKKK